MVSLLDFQYGIKSYVIKKNVVLIFRTVISPLLRKLSSSKLSAWLLREPTLSEGQ